MLENFYKLCKINFEGNLKNLFNKILVVSIIFSIATSSAFAIEDTASKKNFFSFFKREKNEVKLEKTKKSKRAEISEIELPAIIPFKKAQQNYITMSLKQVVMDD